MIIDSDASMVFRSVAMGQEYDMMCICSLPGPTDRASLLGFKRLWLDRPSNKEHASKSATSRRNFDAEHVCSIAYS